MCPGTLALASAAISATSAVAGGIAQGNAANYQSQVARNNATTARQNEADSAAAGSSQAQQAGLKARQQFGQVRAAAAANNLDVNTGSPQDVQVSQREIGGLDTATVANNAALQTYGYATQATTYDAQSALDSSEAQSDYIGGALSAVAPALKNPAVDSLISGPPSVPDNYSWMQGDSSLYAGPDTAASLG